MPKELNYEAGIEFSQGAPFSVQVDPKVPPGDRFADFIPRQQNNTSVTRTKRETIKKPAAFYEDDYISPAAATSLRKSEKTRIAEMAKEIYAEESQKRSVYAGAKKLVDAATKEELANPDKELTRAIKITSNHVPMTKEEALQKAAKQFYGLK